MEIASEEVVETLASWWYSYCPTEVSHRMSQENVCVSKTKHCLNTTGLDDYF